MYTCPTNNARELEPATTNTQNSLATATQNTTSLFPITGPATHFNFDSRRSNFLGSTSSSFVCRTDFCFGPSTGTPGSTFSFSFGPTFSDASVSESTGWNFGTPNTFSSTSTGPLTSGTSGFSFTPPNPSNVSLNTGPFSPRFCSSTSTTNTQSFKLPRAKQLELWVKSKTGNEDWIPILVLPSDLVHDLKLKMKIAKLLPGEIELRHLKLYHPSNSKVHDTTQRNSTQHNLWHIYNTYIQNSLLPMAKWADMLRGSPPYLVAFQVITPPGFSPQVIQGTFGYNNQGSANGITYGSDVTGGRFTHVGCAFQEPLHAARYREYKEGRVPLPTSRNALPSPIGQNPSRPTGGLPPPFSLQSFFTGFSFGSSSSLSSLGTSSQVIVSTWPWPKSTSSSFEPAARCSSESSQKSSKKPRKLVSTTGISFGGMGACFSSGLYSGSLTQNSTEQHTNDKLFGVSSSADPVVQDTFSFGTTSTFLTSFSFGSCSSGTLTQNPPENGQDLSNLRFSSGSSSPDTLTRDPPKRPDTPPSPIQSRGTNICPHDQNCYHIQPRHFLEFSHPSLESKEENKPIVALTAEGTSITFTPSMCYGYSRIN